MHDKATRASLAREVMALKRANRLEQAAQVQAQLNALDQAQDETDDDGEPGAADV